MSDLVMSVQKACRILRCFSHEKSNISLDEICKITGYPKSTVHRLCLTLEKEGFLGRSEEGQTFILSPTLYELGTIALQNVDVKSIARKFMVDLVAKTEETTALYIRHGFQRICVEKVESPHDVRQVVTLGRPLPLCVGASGKVLLAWMEAGLQKAYLNILREDPPPTLKQNVSHLEAELVKIRDQGFAISYGERVPDSMAVSVPIFQKDYEVAALTVLGPSSRFTQEKQDVTIKLLLEISQSITQLLKY